MALTALPSSSPRQTAAGAWPPCSPGAAGGLADPGGGDLEFEAEIRLRPWRGRRPAGGGVGGRRRPGPGGRRPLPAAARHPGRRGSASGDGACVLEDEGELRAHLLGGGEEPGGGRRASALGIAGRRRRRRQPAARPVGVGGGRALRRRGRARRAGARRRRPAARLAHPVRAAGRPARAGPPSAGVVLAGVTKHSSLSRGGAPLLGQLELEAAAALGPRAHVVGAGRPHPRRRRARHPGRRRPPRPRRPLRLPHRPARPTSTPSRRSAAAGRPVRRRRLPRLPLPAHRGRPPGRLPGWLRHEVWLRARRRASTGPACPTTSASGPSPTATRLMERF